MEQHPDADLSVYAVWFDVLATDDRSASPTELMTDPRVTHYWDSDAEVGGWLPQQEAYRNLVGRPLAWDIFFVYGPDATWESVPGPVLGSGSTILSARGRLEESLTPLLATP